MSIVEWCEGSVGRYEKSQYISEFTNSVSNLAFIAVSFYSSGNNPHCDRAIRLIGLGSFAFHATESYWGQLFDELPMSLLAYFYFQIVCNKLFDCNRYLFTHLFTLKRPILGRFHQRKVKLPCAFSMRKGVNVQLCKRLYIACMALVWFAYIKYQLYSLFVSFFALQLGVPLFVVSAKLEKTETQKFELSKGALFATLSVGCWFYERYLHSSGQCPKDSGDPLYYLHSYWHLGMAAAHMQFMRCIEGIQTNKIDLN